LACKKEQGSGSTAGAPASAVATSADSQVSEGKVIYMTRCIACHNADPKLPGAIGPEIYGSSVELIRSKVLTNTYPAGYSPKRTTTAMTPFPDLANKIEAIHAYVNK